MFFLLFHTEQHQLPCSPYRWLRSNDSCIAFVLALHRIRSLWCRSSSNRRVKSELHVKTMTTTTARVRRAASFARLVTQPAADCPFLARRWAVSQECIALDLFQVPRPPPPFYEQITDSITAVVKKPLVKEPLVKEPLVKKPLLKPPIVKPVVPCPGGDDDDDESSCTPGSKLRNAASGGVPLLGKKVSAGLGKAGPPLDKQVSTQHFFLTPHVFSLSSPPPQYPTALPNFRESSRAQSRRW